MAAAGNTVFVLVRNKVKATPGQVLTVSDLAELSGDAPLVEALGGLPVVASAQPYRTVSALAIARTVRASAPQADLQLLGATGAVIHGAEAVSPLVATARAVVVSIFLFLGAGLAIINFHADVSMPEALNTVYQMVVGQAAASPLALQVPYSLGVGLGVMLFFRGLGKTSGEVGPLELETDSYEKKLDDHYRSCGSSG
ncbi:MAG: hypothetical protein AB1445_00035 [Bacillota bacterium]